MKLDRIADIPVRHRFVDYVCTMGYSEYENSFTLVRARFADSGRTEQPKNGYALYLHILREPALRANLLDVLVPDAKAEITELREKAIAESGKNYGFTVGITVFGLTGYLLYKLTVWLSRHVGYDWAEMITYIPTFFAFFIIFPVQHAVERCYARRYCNKYSHRLETFIGSDGNEITWCKRCSLNISSHTRTGKKGSDTWVSEYGCEKCWPSQAAEAWESVKNIPIKAHLIDESHYIVSIRRCQACSQHYLQVTTETVDWKDGNDPIYRTIIPIDDVERARLTASIHLDTDVIEGIGIGRRSLKYDWPKDQEPSTYWSTGIHVGVHD